MKLVRVGELPRTPWRNGGGTTTAIASEPEGASFDDCLWRVDLSDIGRAGPFSHLPGLDRTIVPLARGLVLTINDVSRELDPFEPFTFSGDDVTTCEIAAPLTAFNVFTRRGKADPIITRCDGAGRVTGPGALIFYVARGEFRLVQGSGQPERIEAGTAMTTRTPARPVAFEPTRPHSLALCVSLRLA